MIYVVITGSTRGIGLGLAEAFLSRDCAVAINGRMEGDVTQVVERLGEQHDPERVFGHACDVRSFEDLGGLWDAAHARFGRVDIWINNAGIAHHQMKFWEHAPSQVQAVVDTNLVGAMFGSITALRGMRQQGFGSLYNMEGLGSTGRRVAGLTLYGTTKYGMRYLTESLVEETRGTNILVGALSPGMVVTDLLTEQYQTRPEEWERAKRIFNILADRVETVAPWLVERILANNRTGARIVWLTRWKLTLRFLLAPFRKRELFSGEWEME